VDATFVGHPLADLPRPEIDRATYAAQYNLDPKKYWITIMPGSRVKEVRMNLPELKICAILLGSSYEFLLPVASTLDRRLLEKLTAGYPIHLVSEALPALAHSRAGIIASGTATVEAALMGTPFVMVYRVSDLTYLLGRSRVKVPHFAMVNLIAGKEIVAELVQYNFTAEKVAIELNKILPEGKARNKMIARLAEVKAQLKGASGGSQPPVERAAEAVMPMLPSRSQSLEGTSAASKSG
jgi:lipid-A-disaccharide synthase